MADNDATGKQEEATSVEQGAWTPPESQEALDQIVQARVARTADKVEQRVKQEYADYISPGEAEKLRQEIADRDAKLTAYERESIAAEAGLPKGFGSRLQGANADEWSQDAASLAGSLVSGVARVEPDPEEKPSPGFHPKERRGSGGGYPTSNDGLAAKTPNELVKHLPRI